MMSKKHEMNLVDSVVAAGLCTGCGLCEGLSAVGEISMQLSPLGYLRPKVGGEVSSAVEAEIKACCPGVEVAHEKSVEHYNVNWGALRGVKVGYAVDSYVRHMGSSGGVLSALCIHLLESKAVDFVAHIAVSQTDPIANELQLSRTRDDVIRAAGSRYAPSAPLRTLKALLATGERFAFLGKPCDVAALRAYMRLHTSVRDQIPYLLSFMCAGIPSHHGTTELVRAMGADPDQLASFRYRGDGWPGVARAVQRDGEAFEMDYNRSWGGILGKHLQFRCKICADGTGELADIVCADAWYGKDGYPDFEERAGRSLVLARTEAGQAFVNRAEADRSIVTEDIAVDEIAAMQPYQLDRKRLAASRGFATLLARGRTTKYRRLGLRDATLQAGLIGSLRNVWGTYRRAVGEPHLSYQKPESK